MELASTAIGAVSGGGAGAATALQGEKYNRHLHPSEILWIQSHAAQYAKLHPGMTVQEAEKALAQQAYRQVQAGAPGKWDTDASGFLDTARTGPMQGMFYDKEYKGQVFEMFQATSADQKKDTSIFAGTQKFYNGFYVFNGLESPTQAEANAWDRARVAKTKKAAYEAGGILVGSVAVPALVEAAPVMYASGANAIAAYRAAAAGYSLTASAGAGAVTSGSLYTGVAGLGALSDWGFHDVPFAEGFKKRFSWQGLGGSMALGALGGAGTTKMFQWAEIPNNFKNWKTIGGAVIRLNNFAVSKSAGEAVKAIVNRGLNQNESRKKGGIQKEDEIKSLGEMRDMP